MITWRLVLKLPANGANRDHVEIVAANRGVIVVIVAANHGVIVVIVVIYYEY